MSTQMKTNLCIESYSSGYIVEFVTQHPIDWCESQKEMAQRDGLADKCGRPPVPSMLIFFEAIVAARGLITQEEFWLASKQRWGDFPTRETQRRLGISLEEMHTALRVKAFRNFYPSAIDSLHLFSLLVESQVADRCSLDCAKDVLSSTDLTLEHKGKPYTVALHVGTVSARDSLNHKKKYRGAKPCDFTVTLKMNRPKEPGNKRWLNESDLQEIIDEFKYPKLIQKRLF